MGERVLRGSRLGTTSYETAFKFQQVGFASAMFLTIGLIVLAVLFATLRLLRRAER